MLVVFGMLLRNRPQTPILKTFKSFICGEYRSRTDDLLNANQAL